MTDDELDLLASAYVDGEATPEEVAMVERDPELQARVEAFRAVVVDEPISPPAGLLDSQVAVAMAEFDVLAAAASSDLGGSDAALDGDGQETAAPVVDLRAESIRRSGREYDRATAGRVRPATRPRRTMPSWLPAAAGFVIIGGGLIWAIGQAGGGGDDDAEASETAVAAFDGDEGTDAAAETEAMEEADAGEAQMAADDAMEDDSDDGMDESAADGESRSDAAGAAPTRGDSDESAEESEDAEADFAVPEPLLFFDTIPDPDTIEVLPDAELDLERSLCGAEIVTATLGDPVGFIPVEVESQPAELFLFLDGDGSEIRVLVDDNCQPLQP